MKGNPLWVVFVYVYTYMGPSRLQTFVSFFLLGILSVALTLPQALYADTSQMEPVGSSTSLNWAGYEAEGGTFTGVTGSWIVPQTPTSANTAGGRADATWVGIGGARSRDLIQAGTQTLVSRNGAVEYQAWYEMLPDASIPVPLTVKPGDSITATVAHLSDSNWRIIIANNTSGKQYEKTVTYNSSYSSAEWVQERVSTTRGVFLPLNDFGSVTFTNASAVKDGTNQPLSQFGARPVSMINSSGQILANISSLDQSGTFTVTRNTTGQVVPTMAATREQQDVAVAPGNQVYVITFTRGHSRSRAYVTLPAGFSFVRVL